MKIICSFDNLKQLEYLLSLDFVNELIIDRANFSDEEILNIYNIIKNSNKIPRLKLEKVSRYDDNNDLTESTKRLIESGITNFLIENIDSFSFLINNGNDNLDLVIDFDMNVYNNVAKKSLKMMYNNIKYVAAVELNKYELKDSNYDVLIVYGKLPLMVTANCIYKTNNKCDKNPQNKNFDKLYDRLNKNFIFKSYCKYCYNIIYNNVPLYLLDENINDLNIESIRFDFTDETINEIENILVKKIKPSSFTKGHFIKSIY